MTTPIDPPQPAALGEGFMQELLWIHNMIRRDLQTVRELASAVADGATPEQVRAEIDALQTHGPLWKLRVNCMYYCRFVHSHHHFEDAAWFPTLRRSNPALNPIVDKLEADHRQISDYLDEVEATSRTLGTDDTVESRKHLVAALNTLAEHLLAHLSFEEESVGPTLRSWNGWPAD